jgi:hypothetical protein
MHPFLPAAAHSPWPRDQVPGITDHSGVWRGLFFNSFVNFQKLSIKTDWE